MDNQNKEYFQWVRASERLPEGTAVAKHPTYGPCEMSVHNDRVMVSGYNLHCSYLFSDTELYVYEWLSPVTHLPPPESDVWVEVPVSARLPRKAGANFSIVVPVLADKTFLCLAFNDSSTGKWWDSDEQGRELYGITHWLERQYASQLTAQSPAKGYSVEDMEKLVSILKQAIEVEEKKFKADKDSADWFNNNTPNVGQTIDYQTYSPLPKWVQEATLFINSLK